MMPIDTPDFARFRAELRAIAQDAPRVQRFSRNEMGRDFVIGDVHGAFDTVWEAMKQAGFDRRRDRLFSVGDLIDRGPGSHRAGAFLDQPYVHAIPGNHEVDLLELHLEDEDPTPTLNALAAMNYNGMGWLARVSWTQRAQLLQRFAALPLVIEIETERGRVGLVHGEVPRGMDWPTFIAGVERGDEAIVASCLKGRQRIQSEDLNGVEGIDRIFCGHTPRFGGAQRLGNVYFIDTGAVFAEIKDREGARLTLADLAFKTATLNEPRQEARVDLHLDRSQEPFGDYASRRSDLPRPGR